MDKKGKRPSQRTCWLVAGALLAAVLVGVIVYFATASADEPQPAAPQSGTSTQPTSEVASSDPSQSSLPTEDSSQDSQPTEEPSQDSQPSTDGQDPAEPDTQPTEDNTPQLYNPDGTPPLPSSDPNQTDFQISGFTALTGAATGKLDDHTRLAAVGLYTGPFMEDGKDEEKENVLALIVENTSDQITEFTQLEMQVGDQTATFRISGLPAHSCCLVLEYNAMTASTDIALTLPEVTQYAPLRSAVIDYSADFLLYPATGVINIQNCSGQDLEKDIYVYYKTFTDGVYMGGIAYRASFLGGLKKDAIGQSIQKHFQSDTSVILYMNYED